MRARSSILTFLTWITDDQRGDNDQNGLQAFEQMRVDDHHGVGQLDDWQGQTVRAQIDEIFPFVEQIETLQAKAKWRKEISG